MPAGDEEIVEGIDPAAAAKIAAEALKVLRDAKLTHLLAKVTVDDTEAYRAAANSYNTIVADAGDDRCLICDAPGHTSHDCPVLTLLESVSAKDPFRKKLLSRVLSDFWAQRRLPLNK